MTSSTSTDLGVILRLIGRGDCWNLRSYAQTSEFVICVKLLEGSRLGRIRFGRLCGFLSLDFEVSPEDDHLCIGPQVEVEGFLGMPDSVLSSIISHATSCADESQMNPKRAGPPSPWFGVLWVNRKLRSVALKQLIHTNHIEFHLATSLTRILNISQLGAMDNWPFRLASDFRSTRGGTLIASLHP
jgi:hypothetical protein